MMIKRFRSGIFNPIFLVRNLQQKKKVSTFSSTPPPGLDKWVSAPLKTTGGALYPLPQISKEDFEKILVAKVNNGVYEMEKIFTWKEHNESLIKISRFLDFARVETFKEKETFRKRFNIARTFTLVSIFKELSTEFIGKLHISVCLIMILK